MEPPRRLGPVMQLFLFAWFLARFAAAAAVTAAFAALALLVWFGFTTAEKPDDETAKTDAIIVLTGRLGNRIQGGYEALQKGLSNRMFVTGVDQKVTKPQLMTLLGNPPPELAARIELGFRAANTVGNANETAAWFNSQNLKSMRLVTANYHMRRSILLFRRAMPDARIHAHPVVPKGLGAGEWWTTRENTFEMAHEMAKYFVTLLHIPID